jgi:hypothetical protein
MNWNILRKSEQQAAFSAAIIRVLFQYVPGQNRFLDLIKGEIVRPSFDFSMKRIFILVLLDFLLYFINGHITFATASLVCVICGSIWVVTTRIGPSPVGATEERAACAALLGG